ncbi:MAG: hypothetical protein IKI33_00620, partial [Eubacterium sp.]|nr:hypothetical protein [Eubacterium sp.]
MTKKILSILLAICLIFSTGAIAYADEAAEPEISEEEKIEARIDEIMREMTLKEKVAQMILYDVPADAKATQEKYQFGGYLLFANSFEKATPKSIKK